MTLRAPACPSFAAEWMICHQSLHDSCVTLFCSRVDDSPPIDASGDDIGLGGDAEFHCGMLGPQLSDAAQGKRLDG